VESLELLWPEGRKITLAKRNDLKRIMFLIPLNERADFRRLLTDPSLPEEEDLDGFDEDYDPEDV
jgi:hypothetical protein